jgi:kynurenine formamidase
MTDDPVTELVPKVSNWGRWGPDDEVGTPNTITPEKVVRAAGLVRTGRALSLAIPLDANGPQSGRANRFNPIRTMIASGSDVPADNPPAAAFADDVVTMPLQSAAHWDGLGHVFHDGQMYNGRPAAMVSSNGAEKNGIQHLGARIVTRGILLDLPRHRGAAPALGEAIEAEELQAVAGEAGLEIEPGDALLIRTGAMTPFLERDDWRGYADGDQAGLSYRTVEWLRERDVAAVAADNYRLEVWPPLLPGVGHFHLLAIVHMGLLVGELFYLEELAAACAGRSSWEFLFVAPPLPFTGAVGSPVNPLAIF